MKHGKIVALDNSVQYEEDRDIRFFHIPPGVDSDAALLVLQRLMRCGAEGNAPRLLFSVPASRVVWASDAKPEEFFDVVRLRDLLFSAGDFSRGFDNSFATRIGSIIRQVIKHDPGWYGDDREARYVLERWLTEQEGGA